MVGVTSEMNRPHSNHDIRSDKERRHNIVRAIRHISSNVSEDGYTYAATDYNWYKTMWFRDSAFISSSLSYAGWYLSRSASDKEIEASEVAKRSSERIIWRLWSTINRYSDSMCKAVSIPYENPNFKMLRNHVPARFGRDGNLTHVDLGDGMVLDDRRELDNPNSWIKQYDSVPLAIHAAYEFIKHFGDGSLSNETKSLIRENIVTATDYMIKVYKTPCADIWEQNPQMLNSYSIASVFMGLKLSVEIADRFGISIDKERIYGEIYGEGGLKEFINNLFVYDGLLIRRRDELSDNGINVKEVDSAAYIISAIFDPDRELLDGSVYKRTIEVLAQNEVFRSTDGSRVYIGPLPRRYIGDRYFGGGAWPLLGAIKAYLQIMEGRTEAADNVISYIEGIMKDNNMAIPEQEPMDESMLNPEREGVYDAPGNKPAGDLLWSAAEYIRVCTAYLESEAHSNIIRR